MELTAEEASGALIVAVGVIQLGQLPATTVTKGDIMAVLASIKPFITKALLASRRVVLNDLGAFTIGLQGKCYNSETMASEDFRPSEYIRGHRILFRPEVKLKKDVAAGIQLKRISSEAMA